MVHFPVMILFTKYAQEKFDILERHKVFVTKEQVQEALTAPDSRGDVKAPLLFAQKNDDMKPGRALRVCYKMSSGMINVITFYPVITSENEKE